MAIKRAQVSSLSALATWMQANAVPSIFKSVTYENSTITATDADDNVVLEIKGGYGGYFRAFRGSDNYFSIGLQYIVKRNSASDIIGCDNGFMLTGQVEDSSLDTKDFAFLCAKTNNDKVAIVYPSSYQTGNARYTTALNHVAFGDSATIATTTTLTPEAGQQNCLVPFATNANIGDTSYTPYAYYIAMGTNYAMGFGKFEMGGSIYISNGYWAIREGS